MSIDTETARRVAKLARIKVEDAALPALAGEFNRGVFSLPFEDIVTNEGIVNDDIRLSEAMESKQGQQPRRARSRTHEPHGAWSEIRKGFTVQTREFLRLGVRGGRVLPVVVSFLVHLIQRNCNGTRQCRRVGGSGV